MAYKEFFYLDTDEYGKKIQAFVDGQQHHEIQSREVAKVRRIYSAWAKCGIGALSAVYTHGVSLASSAIAIRQRYIACTKLRIIHEAMARYGIPFHVETKRDKVIPVVAAVLGTAVSMGVGLGVHEVLDSGVNAAVDAATPGLEHTVNTIIEHPNEFFNGISAGGEAETNAINMALEGRDAVSEQLAQASGASFNAGSMLGNIAMIEAEQVSASVMAQRMVTCFPNKVDYRPSVDSRGFDNDANGSHTLSVERSLLPPPLPPRSSNLALEESFLPPPALPARPIRLAES